MRAAGPAQTPAQFSPANGQIMTPQASPRKSEANTANCTGLILARETGLHIKVGGHRKICWGYQARTHTWHTSPASHKCLYIELCGGVEGHAGNAKPDAGWSRRGAHC